MKSTNELNSNYGFSASLNDGPVASGKAGGDTQLNPVTTSVPVSSLHPVAVTTTVSSIRTPPQSGR